MSSILQFFPSLNWLHVAFFLLTFNYLCSRSFSLYFQLFLLSWYKKSFLFQQLHSIHFVILHITRWLKWKCQRNLEENDSIVSGKQTTLVSSLTVSQVALIGNLSSLNKLFMQNLTPEFCGLMFLLLFS